jgi:Family of unknown function (DUF6518)
MNESIRLDRTPGRDEAAVTPQMPATRQSAQPRIPAATISAALRHVRIRVLLVIAAGLSVGALTSVGQTHLAGALNAVVNSASVWLIGPFFVGSRMRSSRGAAAAGLAVCLLELVGYYATSELRGFSTGVAIVAFWTLCAVVGGPLFGASGRLWRTGGQASRGLGASILAAAFLAEGTWQYLHVLHYYATAALWIAIGMLIAITMTDGMRQRHWLAVTVTLGIGCEMLLTHISSQGF